MVTLVSKRRARPVCGSEGYYGMGHHRPGDVWDWLDSGNRRVHHENYQIDIHTWRLSVFREKGLTCCACGSKAWYFRSEAHDTDQQLIRWYHHPLDETPPVAHLNLYGYCRKRRAPMLFTVDHLVPISHGVEAGGTNEMSNLATMCMPCNQMKGNDADWHIDLPRNHRGDLVRRPHKQIVADRSVKREQRMKWDA